MFLCWVLVVCKSKDTINTWAKTFGLVKSQELELVVASVGDRVDADFIFEEFSFEMSRTVIEGNVIFFKFLLLLFLLTAIIALS